MYIIYILHTHTMLHRFNHKCSMVKSCKKNMSNDSIPRVGGSSATRIIIQYVNFQYT